MLPNVHLVFYGTDLELRGLFIDTLDKIDLKETPNPEFLPGHRYLVLYNDEAKGSEEQPFQIIQSNGIHYGPRGENHFDYTKCPYLTTRDGIIFKFIYKRYERSISWLDETQYESMLPMIDKLKTRLRNAELETGISKRTGSRWYRLTFEKLKEVGDDVRSFCEKTDYVKKPMDIEYSERIRTKDRIKASFEYFLSQPKGDIFGHDFETAYGFPMEDPDFKVMGLGIAHLKSRFAVYYDIQWMQSKGIDGEYEYFLEYFNKWLDKFEDSVAYNHAYEQKVVYLMTKRLCLFDEGATINKCDGLVYKRFSLKYTVQRALGLKSWDDEFDLLTGEWLPELFGYDEDTEEFKWKLKADGLNTLEDGTEVPNDYKHNPVWKLICERWPNEVSEFEDLISHNYGESFACIPSNIQTEYCCRDSLYAAMLKEECLKKYSKLCYETYNHNLQLEAILHLTGFFCDEDLRLKMELRCLWMQIYGKLQITLWGMSERMKWFKDYDVPEIPNLTKLISLGYDPCNSKSIIMDYLSDTSVSGLDEEALEPLLGKEVLEIYKDYIKDYCYRIDESYGRSRKVFNEIDNKLNELYNPEYGEDFCKFTVNGKEYKINLGWDNLQLYYNTKMNYLMCKCFASQFKFKDVEKLMLPQLGSPNLPKKLYCPKDPNQFIDGCNLKDIEVVAYSLDDVLDFCDQAYNLKSNKEVPYFKFMVFNRFKGLIYRAFASDYEGIPLGTVINDEELEKWTAAVKDMDYSIERIERSAKDLINEDLENLKTTPTWTRYKLNHDIVSCLYSAIIDEPTLFPIEHQGKTYKTGLFCRRFNGYDESTKEPIFDWSSGIESWFGDMKTELGQGFFDYAMRVMGIRCLRKSDDMPEDYEGISDYDWFCENIDSIDIEKGDFSALCKLNYCFQSFKKYNKVLTAYVRGEDFLTHNIDVQYFDENGITPNYYEEKGIHKCYIPFYANQKKSKRWASGYHTIPPKSEMKRMVITPPGYLMSYFDISGAEIRTISFMSQDDFMMNNYHKGLDPYITMARMTFPHDSKDCKDMTDEEYEDFLRDWRGAFKQVLLGSLYGMGPDKMSELAEISPEECEKVQNNLWSLAPKLKKFIEEKSTWAEQHPGFVQSALGDVLELDESDGDDRLARLGINQFIQNYSSVSLADGFMNNIEKSIHHRDEKLNAKDFILRPLGVVHDSCQIYFPTKYLFEMNEYYTRNLSGYLYDIHKILYAFDLEVGVNYYDVCDLHQIDETHIELKGSYTAISKLINKCKEEGLLFRILKLKTAPKHGDPIEIPVNGFEFGSDFKPKLYKSVIDQFYDSGGYAKFNEDKSKFKITLEKIV